MRLASTLFSLLLAAVAGRCAAPSGPWDAFNLAPASRVVRPTGVKVVTGSIQNAQNLLSESGRATFSGNQSWTTLDFGKEVRFVQLAPVDVVLTYEQVGGLISMTFNDVTSSSSLALSFTESPMFISPLTSDDSSHSASNMSYDGVLHLQTPLQEGFWTQPSATMRGGFRYLTLVSTSDASVTVSNVSCTISFMPHVEDMREYSGYFFATDPMFHDEDFLTKVLKILQRLLSYTDFLIPQIWYSGAYTVQTVTVPLHTGRQVSFVSSPGWANNATLGVAGPIIVDGAKRDRSVISDLTAANPLNISTALSGQVCHVAQLPYSAELTAPR